MEIEDDQHPVSSPLNVNFKIELNKKSSVLLYHDTFVYVEEINVKLLFLRLEDNHSAIQVLCDTLWREKQKKFKKSYPVANHVLRCQTTLRNPSKKQQSVGQNDWSQNCFGGILEKFWIRAKIHLTALGMIQYY